MNKNIINAVFEGGGVKGTGLVGAIAETERLGYEFAYVAGTSAGAIIAAGVAAGYTSAEMNEILEVVDYSRFKDESWEDKIPFIGPAISILLKKGLYDGDYFEQWMRDILAKKNIHTFADLRVDPPEDDPRYRYRLHLIASDVTRGKLLVLPEDLEEYGINPDEADVAHAVRMSMSIPYFYNPVILKDKNGAKHHVVDGGILSNFPVWLFDDDPISPSVPTIGYKLVEPDDGEPSRITGPISLLRSLFSTMMEAHDARYIKDSNFLRTVPIRTLGVKTTDFDLSLERKRALYDSGINAATQFFEEWNFEEYKTRHAALEHVGRRTQIMNEGKASADAEAMADTSEGNLENPLAEKIARQQKVKEERKQRILDVLQEKKRIANNEIEELLGVSDATATNYTDELEREGKIVQKGGGRSTYYELK